MFIKSNNNLQYVHRSKQQRCFVLLAVVFATLTMACVAQANDSPVPGLRWGSRVIGIQNDQITVKLMMVTGNCVSPPMDCDGVKTNIKNGLAVSGYCTSEASMYGSAGEEMVIPDMQSKNLSIGQDVDVWIGDREPTFVMPACITAE